jgi:predicted Zn-dependent peptidase
LGNSILGQFGMYGRIGDVVREQAGLAYYAYSSLAGGPGPGPWSISAGVDPANVDQAIDLILAEVSRFVNEPVSDEELENSRANFIGRLPLFIESNAVAGALVNLERYQLGQIITIVKFVAPNYTHRYFRGCPVTFHPTGLELRQQDHERFMLKLAPGLTSRD